MVKKERAMRLGVKFLQCLALTVAIGEMVKFGN